MTGAHSSEESSRWSSDDQGLVTNYELDRVKVRLPRKKDLYIGNFYMSHRNMGDIMELERSLQQLFDTPNPKNTLLDGDFN